MSIDHQVEFLFHRGLVRNNRMRAVKTPLQASAYKWTVRMDGGPQRVNHAAVQVGERIFSFGGFCTGEDYAVARPIDVFVLDVNSLQWQSVPQVDALSDDVPFQRYGHTVFAYGKYVYLYGGRNDKGACSRLYQFNTETGTWKKIITTGSMPGCRDGHSSCSVGNMVYIFGGFEERAHTFSNDVYALNLDTFVWKFIESGGQPPTPRDFHSACVIGSIMYIFGGRANLNGGFEAERDVYCNRLVCYDTDRKYWFYPPQRGVLPSGRRSHSSFVYRGEMYILGGFDSTKGRHFGDMFCFNPSTLTWRPVAVNVGRVGPPCPRRRHISIIVDDRLFVFGGTSPRPDDHNLRRNYPHSPENLIDHDDLYILDFKPSLKTLSLGTVIENGLETQELPLSLQEQIKLIISHEPRPRKTDNAG